MSPSPTSLNEAITHNGGSLLDPGEVIQAVIPAQTRSGWLGAHGSPLMLLVSRFRPIIVTDRRIMITDAGRFGQERPRSVVVSLPRATRIGPASGRWWKCVTLGESLYVHKRFHKDVEVADALLDR